MQCSNLTLLENVTPAVYHTQLRYILSKIIATKLFGEVEADSTKLIFENDQNLQKNGLFCCYDLSHAISKPDLTRECDTSCIR